MSVFWGHVGNAVVARGFFVDFSFHSCSCYLIQSSIYALMGTKMGKHTHTQGPNLHLQHII